VLKLIQTPLEMHLPPCGRWKKYSEDGKAWQSVSIIFLSPSKIPEAMNLQREIISRFGSSPWSIGLVPMDRWRGITPWFEYVTNQNHLSYDQESRERRAPDGSPSREHSQWPKDPLCPTS
jgi:hypothetical protein